MSSCALFPIPFTLNSLQNSDLPGPGHHCAGFDTENPLLMWYPDVCHLVQAPDMCDTSRAACMTLQFDDLGALLTANKTQASISTLVSCNSKPCVVLIPCDDKWQALSSHHSGGDSLPADRRGAHGSCWEAVPLFCGGFRVREAQAAHHLWRQVEGIGPVDPCRSLGRILLGRLKSLFISFTYYNLSLIYVHPTS